MIRVISVLRWISLRKKDVLLRKRWKTIYGSESLHVKLWDLSAEFVRIGKVLTVKSFDGTKGKTQSSIIYWASWNDRDTRVIHAPTFNMRNFEPIKLLQCLIILNLRPAKLNRTVTSTSIQRIASNSQKDSIVVFVPGFACSHEVILNLPSHEIWIWKASWLLKMRTLIRFEGIQKW